MAKIKLAGVKRKTEYSPNHIGNDGLIFDLTVQALRELGYDVAEYTESEFLLRDIRVDAIFDMARYKPTIEKLQKMQQKGMLVVNSAFGIDNCTRRKMTQMLLEARIPHPASLIVNTDEDPTEGLLNLDSDAFWIKRGDSHAIHREDVTYVRNMDEAREVLKEFGLRGIPNAVINEHLVGDLVKFYGVADTDFFYHFYPFDLSHSKFGLEEINGIAKQYPFSVAALKDACDKAGEVLNVKIYGGDCVVNKDGSFKIIDFNDWPSFAPCRNEASLKIAENIHKAVQKNINA